MMADAEGVITSVIYGLDQRTRITPETRQALFTVYAPPGVGQQAVHAHLRDVEANVLLVAPDATTVSLQVYTAE
jgi:hypothetical protein